MLVLLTKRKLRPDGCQTVKPPGIFAMPNIFSPPFFFQKLLRHIQDFLRVPRILLCSQKKIPNPLTFILEILFPSVILFHRWFHLMLYFHGSTWVSPWSSTLLPLTRGLQTLLHWGWSWRPAPDHCLLHHLCSHQRCQGGTRSSHCKQNPTGWICQEWFSPPLGLLLMCSKQGKTHLEEHGILDVQPSDTLFIWAPNLNWCSYQGHDSVSWDWHEDAVVQTQCTVCSEWQKLV